VGAIDEFGSDITAITADLDVVFKVLNDKKAKLKQRGNDVAMGWAKFFDAQNQAITAAENALNRVTNAPVMETPVVQPPADVGISAVPPVNGMKL
jgi:hypothetical protein